MEKAAEKTVLLSAGEIAARVAQLAAEISRDYHGKDPILVGALKGAVVFLADLGRALSVPHSWDFVSASSYGNDTQSSGEVQIGLEPSLDLSGRHVLLVEDVYDTGRTIGAVLERLRGLDPASIEVCALLVKDRRHEVEIPVRYVGFPAPGNAFLIGYGLDYAQSFRHLPYIAVLADPSRPGVRHRTGS